MMDAGVLVGVGLTPDWDTEKWFFIVWADQQRTQG
jgi:hypothetical protein